MSAKERFQNPAVGDDLTLRLFSFNSNAPRDFSAVEKVDLYFLDPTEVSESNPDGRVLLKTIQSSNITKDRTGEYSINVNLAADFFVIGSYKDVWTVVMQDGMPSSTIEQWFEVHPNLWFTTPCPLAYDFSFDFRPNKIRKGARRYLIINVTPNVPSAPDLMKYYAALIVSSPIKIYIEMVCGQCMPEETDLRMVVEGDSVVYRERNDAFYQIDTADLDEGIYDVWFEMELGDNIYVSDRQQLQIY